MDPYHDAKAILVPPDARTFLGAFEFKGLIRLIFSGNEMTFLSSNRKTKIPEE